MSNIYTWGDVLRASFQDIWVGVANFIPSLIAAIVLFLVGWLIAVILGRLVAQVIKAIKLDTALKGAGFDKVLDRAGFNLNSGAFIGALVKWFFIVVSLVAALEIIGLEAVTGYLSEVVLGYLPKVIVAALILLVSVVIAEAVQKIVVSAAKAANLTSAHVLGEIAKWAIWIFAFMFALSQLQILNSFIQPLFIGIIAAISLALGLSFGLGGRDAAARYIEKVKHDVTPR
jgi:ABC-type multidrug transport system fused ATPase/permease subunit